MRRLLGIGAVLLSLASPAFAQVAVDPRDPTSNDDVTLNIQFLATCPPPPSFTRNGFDIVVTVNGGICAFPPVLITQRIDLGVLPAGTYKVTVTGGANATFAFTVLDATGITVQQSIGSSAGGTTVDVTAAGIFCQGKVITTCAPPAITFGGVAATNVSVIDFSHFRATTPAHAPGVVQVAINGDSIAMSAYSFHYYDPALPPSSKFFEMVLVPVILNAPAANGSNWVTEVSMKNDNTYAIEPWQPIGGARSIDGGKPLRFGSETSAPDGIFLVVTRGAAPQLGFRAVVRDTSKSSTDLGTEIPVVREAAFSNGYLELLDIPVDPLYRTMLRVYANPALANGPLNVGVSIYSMDDGRELRGFFLPLESTGGADHPLFAGLPDLTSNIQAKRIGIRLSCYTPIWAFVTITNNETQHVTVVSPH